MRQEVGLDPGAASGRWSPGGRECGCGREGGASVRPLQGLVELASAQGVAAEGLWEHTEQRLVILWGGTAPRRSQRGLRGPVIGAMGSGREQALGGRREMRGRLGAEQSGAGPRIRGGGVHKGRQDSGQV